MNVQMDFNIARAYKSASQIARVVTEAWVACEGFCPQCGEGLQQLPNNSPVADFICKKCNEEYELKSKNGGQGRKIVDGAYSTMIERLNADNNPHFFFLTYDRSKKAVQNLIVIPKHFFVPEIIEQRAPLPPTARRAGWVGCNILLGDIPDAGKIFCIKNGVVTNRVEVVTQWQKFSFLSKSVDLKARGWLLDTMRCIEKINKQEFTLQDIYVYVTDLERKYPNNKHIKDKLRQQLQILRDKDYLNFVGRGVYQIK